MSIEPPHVVRVATTDRLLLEGLVWPAAADAPGVVVVHGAGSNKENHRPWCELAAAAGLAVLAIDLRGHGASDPAPPGPGFVDDVLAAVDHLAGRGHVRVGIRGSSLGGFLALHAAVRDARVRAVAAVCAARSASLARRYDATWPLALDLDRAVSGRDGVARGYWHAAGDETVPWGHSFRLAGMSHQPRHLRVAMGGTHISLQRDPVASAEQVAFLGGHLS